MLLALIGERVTVLEFGIAKLTDPADNVDDLNGGITRVCANMRAEARA